MPLALSCLLSSREVCLSVFASPVIHTGLGPVRKASVALGGGDRKYHVGPHGRPPDCSSQHVDLRTFVCVANCSARSFQSSGLRDLKAYTMAMTSSSYLIERPFQTSSRSTRGRSANTPRALFKGKSKTQPKVEEPKQSGGLFGLGKKKQPKARSKREAELLAEADK